MTEGKMGRKDHKQSVVYQNQPHAAPYGRSYTHHNLTALSQSNPKWNRQIGSSGSIERC
jgi:hypothetical protein